MIIKLQIDGAPRTKKNSSQLVFPGRGYDVWLQTIVNWVRADCNPANKPKLPYARLIPSEAYRTWFDHVMTQAPILVTKAREQGADLPITEPVSIKALIYRDRNWGDWSGFTQGLGDFLQAPQYARGTYRQTRRGAGIILDDRQIHDWDGTRLLKDADHPRIEVEITILNDQQIDLELPAPKREEEGRALDLFS